MSEKEKKIKPFVFLNNCSAIIDNMDYDSDGRFTYMPYLGIDYTTNNPEEICNKVINTQDEYNTVIDINNAALRTIQKDIDNLEPKLKYGSVNNAIDILADTLEERLISEIQTEISTVFYSGLRKLYLPFITNQTLELEYVKHLLDNIRYSNRAHGMFNYDSYTENGYLIKNRYTYNKGSKFPMYDPYEIFVKSVRVTNNLLFDIACMYNDLISYIMNPNCLDVHEFASDALKSMGLSRDQVSEDNDFPYCSSVLHERAQNDLMKIAELVEASVSHIYYIFIDNLNEYNSYNPQKQIQKTQQNNFIEQKDDPNNAFESSLKNAIMQQYHNNN